MFFKRQKPVAPKEPKKPNRRGFLFGSYFYGKQEFNVCIEVEEIERHAIYSKIKVLAISGITSAHKGDVYQMIPKWKLTREINWR